MANGIVVIPSNDYNIVSAGKLLEDLDDHETIRNYYSINRVVIFRFKTLTLNQPVSGTWGFLIVYYGGTNDTWQEWYFNKDGIVRMRNYINGIFSAWNTIH